MFMDFELDEVFVLLKLSVVDYVFYDVEFFKDNNVMVVVIKCEDGKMEYNFLDECVFWVNEMIILFGYGEEINWLRKLF